LCEVRWEGSSPVRSANHDDGKGVFCNAANPCLGRAPSDTGTVACADDVDAHLALARRVEADSVAAFRDLARWGAPARPQRACTRAAMAAIADEETAHAHLSFEIAAWARTVLGDAELDAARRDALAQLRVTLGYRPGDAVAAELGWPSRAVSAAMLDALAPVLA